MPDSVVENRSESLLRGFFEHARSPFLIVDNRLEIVSANAAAVEMLALEDESHGNLLTGFWSVSAPAVKRHIGGVRRGVAARPVSVRTARDRLVEVDVFTIRAGESPLLGVVVTDRASVDDAQRRLREQEERYRSLFEWSPVAMREEDFTAIGAWLDGLRADGVTDLRTYMESNPADVNRAIKSIRTSRVNAATVELLKAPSVLEVLRGFRDDELTPQVLGAFMDQFETLWEGASKYEADFVGINFQGEPFECRLRWIVPKGVAGRDLARVAVSLLDLTEMRGAQRRLERLVADKDRFIASVSHELRTPLAAVFGLSEELATNWERFDDAEVHELVGLVAAQSAELSSIVEDLLVAANLEMGRVAIVSDVVDLNRVVSEALADCRRSAPDMSPVEISDSPVTASADAVRVRQIIRNLVTNAIRYGGDTISVRIGGSNRPYVEVIDDGDGVALEQRQSIFVPYYQASDGEKVLGSLGLGLSISRELARRMGGELSYSYQDHTSVFRLDLLPA